MGGSRAIREIHAVCARTRKPNPTSIEGGAEAEQEGERGSASWSSAGNVLRLTSDREKERGGLRGIAGLAAFRASLGEVAIGPWRENTPYTFGRVGNLRAVEVAFWKGATGDTLVDFSLAWEVVTEGWDGKAETQALHWDLWVGESEGGWRWLGRAYGHKHRLRGLSIGGGGKEGALNIAVQEINAMGYRQVRGMG